MPKICVNCKIKNNDSDVKCKLCRGLLQISPAVSLQPSSGSGPLQTGTLLENRYKIIKLLKAGGMGAVYKASDIKLDCICAVKELRPDFGNPQDQALATKWFNREAKILAKLSHANLPKVSDYFLNSGRYYLVMDFIEGEDLDTILKRDGKPGLPEEKVIKWTKQVLNVLDYLHNLNPPVIYRDIKPANIMEHKDGRAMLIDFGIAMTVDPGQHKSGSGTRIGTEGYTPLEQYQGKPEPRSDLYALGATVHHLITGIEPIPLHFKKLRDVNPAVSIELENIVVKALKENPAERFSSAKDMLNALNFKKITKSAPELEKEGLLLIEQKRYGEALKTYDMALVVDPSYTPALYKKGLLLDKLCKPDEAVDCYDKALQLDAAYIPALFSKGKNLLKGKKYGEALICLDEIIKIDAKHLPSWLNRGIALYYMGNYEGAIHSYDRALKINPDYKNAKEERKKALPEYEKKKKQEEMENKVKKFINEGSKLFLEKKYEEASEVYDKALKIKPDEIKLYLKKGYVLLLLRKSEEAIRCYDEALKVKPDESQAWTNRGIAFYYLGKYKEAMESYDEALKVNSADVDALVNKGVVLDLNGEYEESIKYYDSAFKIAPEKSIVKNRRQYALNKLEEIEKKKKNEQAKEFCKTAEGFKNQGNYKKALNYYKEALILNPDCDEAKRGIEKFSKK